MIQAQRIEAIRDYLSDKRYASIRDLSNLLQMSPATVRRCLEEMEGKQIIERVRGGATLLGEGNTFEHPYSIKRRRNETEKKRIAEYASSMINANNSIYMDASSTVRGMTASLKTKKNITVCTNDVLIAGDLSSASDLIVMVTGGILRQGFYSLSGHITDESIASIQVDYAFMGIDAVSESGWLMLTNFEDISVKHKISKQAQKIVVLTDHDKFNHSAFINVWRFSDIFMVITGREMPDAVYERYTELGLNIKRV